MTNEKTTDSAQFSELNRVCHDLRNLLTAIMGYAQLIPEVPVAKVPGYANQVEKASRQMLDIVNDALDRAKLLDGNYKAPMRVFAIPEQIADMVKVFSARAGQLKVDISIQVDDDLPAQVIGSPMHVCEILSNLLSNALKFVGENGSITLRAELAGSPATVRFLVTDNGPGMPPELCQRLFQPFVQGDHQEGGSGLGLSLCRRLVQEIGGQIGVHSTLGQGSTFFFTVPFAPAAGESPEALASLAQSTGQCRPIETVAEPEEEVPQRLSVLVVDDNQSLSTLVVSVLKRFGYDVDLAKDAASALSLVRAKSYSALLVDSQLGEISGAELIGTIRQMETDGTHVIIVGTSGYGDPQELTAAGATDFLAKPFTPIDLKSKFEQLLAA